VQAPGQAEQLLVLHPPLTPRRAYATHIQTTSQLEELSILERENRALKQRAEVLEKMLIDVDKQVIGAGGLVLGKALKGVEGPPTAVPRR